MPVSGRNATTNEPLGSALATRSAPETQPPPEPPVKIPSCFTMRRAHTKHS